MEIESKNQVASYIKKMIAKEQHINMNTIADSSSFFELGLDSISSIYLLELVENEFSIKLTPLDFWDYPTIEEFSKYVFKENVAK